MQPDHWDLRILTAVVADSASERTRVEWDGGLGSAKWHVSPASPPQPFALRKRVNVFGHNAPFKGADRQPAARTPTGRSRSSAQSGQHVDLDGSHPDVIVGSWVVLSKPTYRELWQGDDGHGAVARRLRGVRQGHAARALARRELHRAVRRTRCARRRSSRCRRRSTSPRRRTRRTSRATRSASTLTCRGCGPAGGCIVRGTTTSGERGGRGRRPRGVPANGAIVARQAISRTSSSANTVVVHGNVALGDARRDRAAAARLGTRGGAVPALHARARSAHVRPVEPTRRAHEPRSRCA